MRPSCASSAKIGKKRDCNDEQAEEQRRTASIAASISTSLRGLLGEARSRCLCAFSIMTIAASTMGADEAMAMPPRLMMFELKPRDTCTDSNQHTERQRDDRNQRAAHMQQKYHADQSDDDALLDQRGVSAYRWRGRSVSRTVVDRIERDALRQAGRPFGQPILDVLDDGERVFTETLQHDAGDDFAFAVQLGNTAAFVRRQLTRATSRSNTGTPRSFLTTICSRSVRLLT